MDVLQPRSDQGTASQMVTSGGSFSTGGGASQQAYDSD